MASLGTLSKLPMELIHEVLDEVAADPYHLAHHTGIKTLPQNQGFLLPGVDQSFFQRRLDPLRAIHHRGVESQNALASLCLTSKALNELATPRLYNTLSSVQTDSAGLLLVRTFLERDDLAELVKHLALENPESKLFGMDPSDIPSEITTYYAEQVALLGPNNMDLDADDFNDPEGRRQGAALLNLLISLCPNLDTLDCIAYSQVEHERYGLCQPGSLSSLQQLRIAHWDTEMSFSLADTMPLIDAAPNLKTLIMQQGGGPDSSESSRLEHVTTLDLQCFVSDAEDLISMLCLCPNLECLRYNCGGPLFGDEQFTPQEAAVAVLAHAPNLKTFELDLIEWIGMQQFTEGDLKEAKRLLNERGVECKFTMKYNKNGAIYLD